MDTDFQQRSSGGALTFIHRVVNRVAEESRFCVHPSRGVHLRQRKSVRLLEEIENPKMASRVNLKYQSKNVTGEKVDFEIEKEDWSIYKLDDGTRLKMRTIVGDIIRLVDEYNAQGDPIYLVQSQNMVSADVPDHLKKDLHGSDEVH